ncbi:GntR family transcriptional regulator [Gordonia amarae]|uniref:GntR family transcriptional regulator n=2 Tax=Gordonia amarae TaxID=36821 RepID=A0A857L1Q4_9ACTN|nr:GntR family transcriptional regulator [Gordonia amarae]MCS3879911.1 DNA-binding GntR family transcriptional regulator [Gordonia amarae]QHN18318.1 GntR family transcriptional regulator [Gordonia amarae]QHN22800.1 GntR family transcriptional regulator [Gordonia amarae]QHN40449.1 GntR family transcriptional regulator [Gordonia amarae]GAB07577.1 putative GntR family transcriptional regulator [Gordonia amarae NBRC 15530]
MNAPEPSEPAYRSLAAELRGRIAAGQYPEGVRLPTEAELATEFGLSRQTVRRAFLELVGDGSVYRIPGRGTFAHENAGRYLRQLGSIEDLMNLSADTEMRVVEPPSRRVDLEAAGRLQLDTDVVWRMLFTRSHDTVPFVLTTVWWPEPVAEVIAGRPEVAAGAVSEHTMIGLLEPHLADPISECVQSITAATADDRVATVLGCPPGHAVLRVDRLYKNTHGQGVELAISYFLPEHYTYRVTLRRSGHSPT